MSFQRALARLGQLQRPALFFGCGTKGPFKETVDKRALSTLRHSYHPCRVENREAFSTKRFPGYLAGAHHTRKPPADPKAFHPATQRRRLWDKASI
ncbi:hypothetical protein D3C81_1129800 [compost metagenome]